MKNENLCSMELNHRISVYNMESLSLTTSFQAKVSEMI